MILYYTMFSIDFFSWLVASFFSGKLSIVKLWLVNLINNILKYLLKNENIFNYMYIDIFKYKKNEKLKI